MSSHVEFKGISTAKSLLTLLTFIRRFCTHVSTDDVSPEILGGLELLLTNLTFSVTWTCFGEYGVHLVQHVVITGINSHSLQGFDGGIMHGL